MTSKFAWTGVVIAAALAASAVSAQPGPRGRFAFSADYVRGWQLMTVEERNQFADKMHSFKTVAECKAYLEEHRKMLEGRAREQGKKLVAPRYNACDAMKAKGLLQ